MKVSDLQLDARNTNKGTRRGRESVAESLKRFGAGRSVLIDKNGRLIAGNKTASEAAAAGITDVVVIQTDGSQLIAVQRVDLDLLTDSKAKGLAVADNRVSELGLEWDAANLQSISAELDLQPFFTPEELADTLNIDASEPNPAPSDLSDRMFADTYSIMVSELTETQQTELLDRLTEQGFTVRSLIS
jgi:hypothetical protein